MGKIMYMNKEFQGRIERMDPDPEPSKKDHILYNWDFTKSLIDTIQSANLYSNPDNLQPSNNGLVFDNNQVITIDIGANDSFIGKTVEMDFGNFSVSGETVQGNIKKYISMIRSDSERQTIPLLYKDSVLKTYGENPQATGYYGYGYDFFTRYDEDPYAELTWINRIKNKTYGFAFPDMFSFLAWNEDRPLYGHAAFLNSLGLPSKYFLVYYNGSGSMNYGKLVANTTRYMQLGDGRSGRSGMTGCEIKGIRIYDGIYVPNPEQWYLPPVTQGGE